MTSDFGQVALSSTLDVIDPEGVKTGTQGLDPLLWPPSDRIRRLESITDRPVYAVKGTDLLARCLKRLKNPFNFAATCYPRSLYQKVAGYGANRLNNPDKWFHWKILSVADTAIFVDLPMFSYRWHPANQNALELASGALKFLIDEYATTLELETDLLHRLGSSRDDVIRAFLETDIINHGLATLARGSRARAQPHPPIRRSRLSGSTPEAEETLASPRSPRHGTHWPIPSERGLCQIHFGSGSESVVKPKVVSTALQFSPEAVRKQDS